MSQSVAERFAKVKESYLRDQEQRPVAKDLHDIPVAYDLISDEWLTNVLCAKVAGARVISHALDQADDGTSNRRRIFLVYNDAGNQAGLPASVFCKATQSLESRYAIGLNRSTEAEAIFYNNIRPVLDIEAPAGLFCNVDPVSLNSILIMKDMTGQVTFCDERTEVPLARARSQVELLAKLHGTFYNPAHQHLIAPYQFITGWCDLTEEAIGWSAGRQVGFKAGEAVIPARLFRRAAEVDPATIRAMQAHKDLPATLVHNDVHLKNWYIAGGGKMGLADWQICVRGSGVRDLAYTISTSLTVENRRNWEVDLIKYYLDCLEAEGASPLNFDETWLAYRQQLLFGLAMWTYTLSPPPGAPDMQPPETSLAFIKRMTHAIDDLDALDCI